MSFTTCWEIAADPLTASQMYSQVPVHLHTYHHLCLRSSCNPFRCPMCSPPGLSPTASWGHSPLKPPLCTETIDLIVKVFGSGPLDPKVYVHFTPSQVASTYPSAGTQWALRTHVFCSSNPFVHEKSQGPEVR